MTDFPDVILADAFFGTSYAICGHLSQICISFVRSLHNEAS
jgi:hypothetical protein